MVERKLIKELRVIEVPFDDTSPMWQVSLTGEGPDKAVIKSYITRPEGRRELHDYKECGVYGVANVPFEVFEISSVDTEKPHEEQAQNISELTSQAILDGKCVLMTGGSCSHAVGVAGGLRHAYGTGKNIGLIWLDAHGDINTPESTKSGLLGGTPLATIAGLCRGEAYASWLKAAKLTPTLKTKNIILSDARDIELQELEILNKTEMLYIDAPGFLDSATWKKAVTELADRVDVIYLHIDADILDARYTPGHYTVTPGGPSMETVMNNIKFVMQTEKVVAFALVSTFHKSEHPCNELGILSGLRLLAAGLNNWKYYPAFFK